jgi:hypothetical protein
VFLSACSTDVATAPQSVDTTRLSAVASRTSVAADSAVMRSSRALVVVAPFTLMKWSMTDPGPLQKALEYRAATAKSRGDYYKAGAAASAAWNSMDRSARLLGWASLVSCGIVRGVSTLKSLPATATGTVALAEFAGWSAAICLTLRQTVPGIAGVNAERWKTFAMQGLTWVSLRPAVIEGENAISGFRQSVNATSVVTIANARVSGKKISFGGLCANGNVTTVITLLVQDGTRTIGIPVRCNNGKWVYDFTMNQTDDWAVGAWVGAAPRAAVSALYVGATYK